MDRSVEGGRAREARACALTAEIATLTLMEQDSPTRFKGKPEATKRVAWADPIPLDEVKAIGRRSARRSTTCCSRASPARSPATCATRATTPTASMIRALVPVNLRPIEKAYKLGNQFGLVFLDLPLGVANPIERLYAVRDNMDALKGSYQPVLALGILAAMGAGPRRCRKRCWRSSRATRPR